MCTIPLYIVELKSYFSILSNSPENPICVPQICSKSEVWNKEMCRCDPRCARQECGSKQNWNQETCSCKCKPCNHHVQKTLHGLPSGIKTVTANTFPLKSTLFYSGVTTPSRGDITQVGYLPSICFPNSCLHRCTRAVVVTQQKIAVALQCKVYTTVRSGELILIWKIDSDRATFVVLQDVNTTNQKLNVP